MRCLVVGAGAIGGYLAARLASAGHPVSVVGRGAHLAAIADAGGIVLAEAGGASRLVALRAFERIDDAPDADVVLVTLKAHQVTAVVEPLARAASRASLLVPVHNGVGWWYFLRGASGRFAGRTVDAVDPGGVLAATLPVDRVVPMLAFKSAEVIEPGTVSHLPSPTEQFVCGELDGARTARLDAFVAAMREAGVNCPVADIRETMWNKLLGNVYANPICALTRVTLGEAIADPDGRALAIALMREMTAVAAAHGVAVPMSPEERIARSAAVGAARPSMLQDRDAGRPMELGAILGAIVELGGLVGIDTPSIRALLACLRVVESAARRTAPLNPGRPS